ncbi:tetratricopeptide repeat protein [Methylobacterium sp. E-046]|uniref:tetratricopeptide repeat protein n=1 Tax=Methylobacterium sp. E-046 TaxID=2836576 RepID=UPI001FB8AF74|nr:tetratricopeptide repeat protein [Methylobacterium sp. E-046]MCJ2099469.1 tetratricopeptide repeat protein [Methylobacterium sp. E-046]
MRHTLFLATVLASVALGPVTVTAADYEGAWSINRRDCGSRDFLGSGRTLIVAGSSLRAKGWACELKSVIGTSRDEIDMSCTGALQREYRRALKLNGSRRTLVIGGLPGGSDVIYYRCGSPPVAERGGGSRATAVRYEDQGERLLKLGDHQEAERLFTKSIAADASYASAFNNRGFAKRLQKRNAEAVEDYDEAIRLEPGTAIYHSNRGVALDALGKIRLALSDFEIALAIDPKTPTALNGRGSVLRQLGQVDRAIVDFEKAVQINPRYVVCFNNLALAYRDKGDRIRALKQFDRALAIEPTNAFALRGKAAN